MTREETNIQALRGHIEALNETIEKQDKTIKELKQSSCEDAVSRAEAYEALNSLNGTSELDKAFEAIEKLPPVTPKGVTVTDFADKCRECGKQKTGHWIDTKEISISVKGHILHEVICSECSGISFFRAMGNKYIGANLCPNCGAKMTEPQKSENEGMYIACKKCKYNYDGECNFYDMSSGNEIDMPCYREKELIKEASDNFLQAFVGAESEDKE